MTPEQIKLIKSTFAQVLTIKEQAGLLFYERLFQIAPEVRPMFKGDIKLQAQKLMDTLALAVGMLRDPSSLVTTLEALATRHVAYGVEERHYDQVGEALIWTLEQGLGPAFTQEARAAWLALYDTVATVMLKAASQSARIA